MDHHSKEFKALHKKWMKKLEQSGFEDIERHDLNTDTHTLKWSSTDNFKHIKYRDKEGFFESKQTYFRLAGFFLHDYKFEYRNEKLIWKWHTEGKSIRQISTDLKKTRKPMAPTQVKECIHRLRALMLKKYENDYDQE